MSTTTKEIKSRLNKDQFLDKIFQRLFAAVGRRYTRQATAILDWYLASSWTLQQDSEFRQWLARECLKRWAISPRMADREARMFLLFYGWRIEENSMPGPHASNIPREVSTRQGPKHLIYAKTNQKRNQT
jgi:hypothetical protein